MPALEKQKTQKNSPPAAASLIEGGARPAGVGVEHEAETGVTLVIIKLIKFFVKVEVVKASKTILPSRQNMSNLKNAS